MRTINTSVGNYWDRQRLTKTNFLLDKMKTNNPLVGKSWVWNSSGRKVLRCLSHSGFASLPKMKKKLVGNCRCRTNFDVLFALNMCCIRVRTCLGKRKKCMREVSWKQLKDLKARHDNYEFINSENGCVLKFGKVERPLLIPISIRTYVWALWRCQKLLNHSEWQTSANRMTAHTRFMIYRKFRRFPIRWVPSHRTHLQKLIQEVSQYVCWPEADSRNHRFLKSHGWLVNKFLS